MLKTLRIIFVFLWSNARMIVPCTKVIRIPHFMLLLIVSMTCCAYSQNRVKGMTMKGTKLYYISGQSIFGTDIKTSKVLFFNDLHKDSSIMNSLYRSVKRQANLKNDSFDHAYKLALNDFTPINITHYKDKVFVGVRFVLGSVYGSKIKYALLEFDESLNLFNHYIFAFNDRSQFFTLPPYYELDFISGDSIVIPIFKNNQMHLCTFVLHKKSHKIMPQLIGDEVGIIKKINVKSNEGIVMEPLIYPVQNSRFKYYFQFPFPLIKNHIDIICDPYAFKPFIDSCDASKKHTMYGLDNDSLGFMVAQSKYNHVILNCTQSMDSIFFVVTHKDLKKIDFIFYHIQSKKYVIKTIEFSFVEQSFYIKDGILYVLNVKNGIHQVESYVIRDILNQ